jgi:hypothetical protein
MLAGSLLCGGLLQDANGQIADVMTDGFGVRHSIFAAVELNRNAGFGNEDAGKSVATVHISVRILDYASDSRFYGVVNGDFSEFDPVAGVAAQEIWADHKCHQNRGLPTISVLALNGRIRQGETTIDFAARPRHIGQPVPGDEIVMQKILEADVTDPMPHLAMRATTKRSPLSVTLTVKSIMCRLKAN